MPKIINAYAEGQNSIADSLKSIGQSIWGDEAKNEGLRQSAEKTRLEAAKVARENAGVEGAANAFRGGNFLDYGANSIRAGRTPDIGAAWLAHEANTRGVQAPQTTNAWAGAGHNYSGSYPGFQETEAGLDRRNAATNERAARSNEAQANNTPVMVQGDDNQPYYTSRLDAITNRRAPVMSKDQVEAGILRQGMRPQAPVAPSGNNPMPPPGNAPSGNTVAGPGAPAWPTPAAPAAPLPQAPQASPLAGLDGPTLAMFGQPVATAELDRRRRESAMGMKLPPEPTQPSAAQRDIEDTSGAIPMVKDLLGGTLNFFGGPDIHPAQTAAAQAANQRIIDTATGLSGVGGLPPSAKGLNIEKGTIPHPSWMGQAAGGDPVMFAKRLRQHWEDTRHIILDPNTTPADREKAYLHLDQLGKTIADWERPRPGAQPAAAPQQAPTQVAGPGAPQGNMPPPTNPADIAHNPQTGQVIYKINGQWIPQ